MRNQYKLVLSTGRILLFGTAGVFVLAAATALSAAQKAAPKEAEVFPHMDAAMGYLKTANAQLAEAEPEFKGHRERAAKHTQAAIADLQTGIDNFMRTHPSATRNEVPPEAAPPAGARFPHMEAALKLLQEAEGQLNLAAHQYNGKRLEGLAETRAAIAEIKAGLAVAHK